MWIFTEKSSPSVDVLFVDIYCRHFSEVLFLPLYFDFGNLKNSVNFVKQIGGGWMIFDFLIVQVFSVFLLINNVNFPISYSHTKWYPLFSQKDMIEMVEELPVKI